MNALENANEKSQAQPLDAKSRIISKLSEYKKEKRTKLSSRGGIDIANADADQLQYMVNMMGYTLKQHGIYDDVKELLKDVKSGKVKQEKDLSFSV